MRRFPCASARTARTTATRMYPYASLMVDLVIVGIVAISALLSYSRGFVREFLTISAIAAAGAATYYIFTHTAIAGTARAWISNQLIADGATVVVLFVAVLVVALIATHPLAERVQGSNLGFLDRWLGFAWGAARGGLIVAILYAVPSQFVPLADQPVWLHDARLVPYVERASDWLIALVPDAWRERVMLTERNADRPEIVA